MAADNDVRRLVDGVDSEAERWRLRYIAVGGGVVIIAIVVDLLAGIGAGLYQADAVNGIPQQHSARLHPDPERARVYDDLYRAYCETEIRLLRE